ncbi:hypothetical protein ACU639_37555 [Streptomyces cynarae]
MDDVRVELCGSTLRTGGFDRVPHQMLRQALDADTPTMLPHGETNPV